MNYQSDRRTFLTASTLASIGAITGCGGNVVSEDMTASDEDPFYISLIGAQLYTVRDLFEVDPQATLAALAEIGIRDCETAGLFDHSAADVRAMMDDLGLVSRSGHVRLPWLRDDATFASTLEDASTLGQDRLYLGWIPEEERAPDKYKALAELLNKRGEEAKAAGMMVGYHNHEFEFVEQDGVTGYGILLEETDAELVTMELDLYWIAHAGLDAGTVFDRSPGRFSAVHIKDRTASGEMASVGDGLVDFKALLPQAQYAGVNRFYIEHDNPEDPIASIGRSHSYIMAEIPHR